ncbi:hypothetical protein [Streptomyces sp. NPDC059928]|uniref:hypothetical protein n=1 Tax=unclassified Streptomyces TaxID=2593676 RepID=UPI003658A7B5
MSETTALARTGFQRLVTEIDLERVGLVLGIEMSRLARSGKGWYQPRPSDAPTAGSSQSGAHGHDPLPAAQPSARQRRQRAGLMVAARPCSTARARA